MPKKIYTIRFSDVTFVALFTVFVIVATTALSGISPHSDTLIVGLVATLAAYTIALQLINQRQNPLKKYIDSTELQVNTSESEEKAFETKENAY